MAAWSKRAKQGAATTQRQLARSAAAQSPVRQAMSEEEAKQLEAAVASKLGPEQAALIEAEGSSRARLVRRRRWQGTRSGASILSLCSLHAESAAATPS